MQWRTVLVTTIQAALALYLFDRLRLISDMSWLESHLDCLSILVRRRQSADILVAFCSGGDGVVLPLVAGD